MTVAEETQKPVDFVNPDYYINRDLSWLQFNDRVLHEAFDPRTPLLERLKFLAIFSSNLDEFFMVRVSGVVEQSQATVTELGPDRLTPEQQLTKIRDHLLPIVQRQHRFFQEELLPLMAQEGIHLLTYDQLTTEQKAFLQDYFEARVHPILTPLGVDPAHPFPLMSNLSLSLAVAVRDPETKAEYFARLKIPNNLPRFISFPEHLRMAHDQPVVWAGVALEDVIANHLDILFPGMVILNYHQFRITRDADFPVREDEADDLMLAIQQEVSKRRLEGSVIRLELHESVPADIREALVRELKITEDLVYPLEGRLNLKDLFFFLSVPRPDLKDKPWTPVIPSRLRALHDAERSGSAEDAPQAADIFAIIREKDLLVHHPYEAFDASVETLITLAARDPQVQAIKMTLYRTSGDSPIVKALMEAAEQKKQVAVLVELKARFDEESNIEWAKQLGQSGIHVVYGVLGLKTHTKTLLIVRDEGDRLRRYAHIGTGNYNSKTAKLYTDLGIMTCRDDIGADLTDLFNFLTGFSRQKSFRTLLIAPVTMRDRMMAMIRREIDHARQGRVGRIIAKMNSLVDPDIIQLLYEASQVGVEIDLIIRGICCLRPGLPGVSDRIRVISIIGRFLEHSRIFYFSNDGQEEIYIGSADWMPRNLDRRVEAIAPVADPDLKEELKDLLDIFLSDNRQAWEMQPDGSYVQRRPGEDEPEQSAHEVLMRRTLG
ncbi:MAG: polyphosphate kinase 1 [Synechococcales bacterium]|nr:polyphosphate kinase 1 [Synechococcales bacterium]